MMRSAWLKVRGERGEEMWLLKEGMKRRQLVFLKYRPSVAEIARDSWDRSLSPGTLPSQNGRALHQMITDTIAEGL